jgi:pyochelin biosynthetic protein PchC
MSDSTWFRSFRPTPEAGVRLICFPHAGGSVGAYLPLTSSMGSDLEVVAVQYPGRQDRRHEPVITDIGELADRILDAWQEDADSRPFAFYGHSMGATVAYEVARRLEGATAASPLALFASARRAPSRVRTERVHAADDAAVLRELVRLGGTDARLLQDKELRELFLPVLRGDYQAIEGYRWTPGPRLNCPISVLIGDRDPLATVDEAREWSEHTCTWSEITVLPGGHFFVDAHLPAVVDIIRVALARLVGSDSFRRAEGAR